MRFSKAAISLNSLSQPSTLDSKDRSFGPLESRSAARKTASTLRRTDADASKAQTDTFGMWKTV